MGDSAVRRGGHGKARTALTKPFWHPYSRLQVGHGTGGVREVDDIAERQLSHALDRRDRRRAPVAQRSTASTVGAPERHVGRPSRSVSLLPAGETGAGRTSGFERHLDRLLKSRRVSGATHSNSGSRAPDLRSELCGFESRRAYEGPPVTERRREQGELSHQRRRRASLARSSRASGSPMPA